MVQSETDRIKMDSYASSLGCIALHFDSVSLRLHHPVQFYVLLLGHQNPHLFFYDHIFQPESVDVTILTLAGHDSVCDDFRTGHLDHQPSFSRDFNPMGLAILKSHHLLLDHADAV